MKIGVVELYRDVLPRTNCGECGQPTCLAFASRVVVDGRRIEDCPHVDPEAALEVQAELDAQRNRGEGTRKDLAADALAWARRRATSMDPGDVTGRVGGRLDGEDILIPYFGGTVRVGASDMRSDDGRDLDPWDQVLIYNHMAQGGMREPTGRWIGIEELPSSTSKVRSLAGTAEDPIAERFGGRVGALLDAARRIGGAIVDDASADLAVRLVPLPRVPVLVLFWDGDREEGFGARVKMLFDETVGEHLDIESVVFLGERIALALGDQWSGRS